MYVSGIQYFKCSNALNILDGGEQVKTILTEKMKTIKLPVQMLEFVDTFYLR